MDLKRSRVSCSEGSVRDIARDLLLIKFFARDSSCLDLDERDAKTLGEDCSCFSRECN